MVVGLQHRCPGIIELSDDGLLSHPGGQVSVRLPATTSTPRFVHALKLAMLETSETRLARDIHETVTRVALDASGRERSRIGSEAVVECTCSRYEGAVVKVVESS